MIPTIRIRSIWTWGILTAVSLVLLAVPARRTPGDVQRREMEHGGRRRTFLLYRPKHAPADERLPLVLAFHGGGGSAGQMLRYSGLHRLADRHHFIVVYPDAIDKHLPSTNTGTMVGLAASFTSTTAPSMTLAGSKRS